MRSLLLAVMLLAQTPNPAQMQTGTITGRLLALNGTPAIGVRVSAMPVADPSKPSAASSGDVPVLAALTQTDASGRYRLENLPAGRYYVLAGFVDSPTYYPGATSTATATAVAVTSRATITGIDFQAARSSTGLTLSGRLKRDTNEGVGGLNIYLGGNDQYPNVSSKPDGSFEFTKLKPGTYSISVSTSNFPPQQIVLADKDISGMEFIIPWTVDVTGNVSVEGGGMRPNLSLTFAGGPRGINTTSGRDTFRITLPEGAYAVAANGVPSGFFVKSIKSGSIDLQTDPLKLSRTSPPTPITVILGVSSPAPWVKLTGRVTGLPSPRTSETRLTMSGPISDSLVAVVGADGSFEFPKLLPGNYSINISPSPVTLPATSIVMPNSDLSGVQISFPTAKEITGRISVEDGGPLPVTSLSLLGSFGLAMETGQQTLAQLLVSSTQPRNSMYVNLNLQQDGTFKATLPEGQYRVTATPQFRNASGTVYAVKAFTYGTTDLTKDSVSVSTKDTASMSLVVGPTGPAMWSKVAGRVTGVDPGILAANPLTVTLNGSGLLTNWTSNVKSDGSFEFPKVYPGTYSAHVAPPGNRPINGNLNFASAAATINVTNADITGLEIAVPRQKEVLGRIILEGRGPLPRFTIPLLPPPSAQPSNIPNLQVSYLSINPQPDGSFRVTILEGERQIGNVGVLPAGYTLKSISYGTTDLLKSPLKVASSDTAELRVTLTTPNLSPVHVSGKLTGVDDPVFARGPVTATLSGSNAVVSLNVPISADRSFQFPEVFPGSYSVRAAGVGIVNSPDVPVVVAGADIADIEIAVPRQKAVNGRVILEGRGPMPRFTIPLLPPPGTQPSNITNLPVSYLSINPLPDGSFRTTIVEGERQLGTVGVLPAGYTLKSITYGTTDLLKSPLKVASSDVSELRVTLTTPNLTPVRVSGKLTGIDDSVFTRGPVTATLNVSNAVVSLSVPITADRSFLFPEVFPGDYFVRASGVGIVNSPNVPVVVAGADIADIEIAVPRQKEISGRVILEGLAPMPRFQISTRLASPPASLVNSSLISSQVMFINPQTDGIFRLTMAVGEHSTGPATGLPAGYSIKSFTYGATDLLMNPLKVSDKDTDELRITITTPGRPPVQVGGRVSGLSESILSRRTVTVSMASPAYVSALSATVMADGTFEFPDVFSGSYTARVSGPGVLYSPTIPVTVANSDVQSIEISLPPVKEITGRVTLEGSGPMVRMSVPVLSIAGTPSAGTPAARTGLIQVAPAGPLAGPASAITISPLQDGTFRLILQEGEQRLGPVTGLPPGYTLKSMTYGSTDVLKNPLTVASSDSFELRAIITTPNPTPVRVSGRVIGLDTASFDRGPVSAAMTSSMYIGGLNTAVRTDGTFEFAAVYPGSYSLRALGPAVLNSPNLTVTVANTDVQNVEIRVPSLKDITGHVVVEGGGPYPLFALPLASLPASVATPGASGTLPTIRPGPEGTFHIGLPAGESRVTNFIGLPPGYTLKAFSYGSTDLLKNPFKVATSDTTELQITLVNTAKPVKVSGRVDGVDLNTISTNPIRVTMTSGSFVAPLTADVRTDGTFEIPVVYPGNYRVSAAAGSAPVPPVGILLVVSDKEISGLVVVLPK